VGQKQRSGAEPGGGRGGLATGMPAADHDDVVSLETVIHGGGM
jgi:hypothetical protein